MLKYLKLENVGPAEVMELELGSRLNILTGDNGLGKSFLLDVAWFVMTGCWPAKINSQIASGNLATPSSSTLGRFSLGLDGAQDATLGYEFDFAQRLWNGSEDARNPKRFDSLVIYLMPDGSCAVFDPFKNESLPENAWKPRELPPAIVLNATEIWEGQIDDNGKHRCKGLIGDWATWQNNGGDVFKILIRALEILSPSTEEPISPGGLTRVSLDDVRDFPTIRMPFVGDVPVIHASSGIRRILSFAYIVVWAWEEHKKAAKFLKKSTTSNVLILFDEVDAHLHPSWQRKVLPSLLGILDILNDDVNLQIIATTHSPLIMASLEPEFNPATDAWFDLDLVGENGHRKVELTKREFEIRGDANKWLMSEAFDLHSSRSEQAENTLKRAADALNSEDISLEEVQAIHADLLKYLPASDVFFIKWDMLGKQKGWWK